MAEPVDLSGGLVPNSSVDLSAGLVPSKQADTRSFFQKAQDSFDANTKTSPSDSLLQTGLKSVVGGAGGMFVHPLDAASGLVHMIAHPADTAHAEVNQLYQDKADGGAAYAATKFVGNAVGGIAAAAPIGELAGAAADAIPKVAGRVALLGKTPEAAYESALKPSTTLSPAERAAAVQTGLQNEIPVSKGGAAKIADLIDDYNQKIKDQIASDPTRPIDPNAVATWADAAKAKFAKQVNAGTDLDAIDASKRQFLAEQGASTPSIGPQGPAPPMNAADAQEMKQGTYQVLKGKFGEQGSASVEAQKSLARGLKEEIATQFPEIGQLNAAESKLLDLQPLLERAVGRISNHQLVGIGTPIAGEAAKAMTGSMGVGVVAGVLKATLDNPMIKSRLAIAISKGAKIPYADAAAKVAAYSTALGSNAGAPSASSTGDTPTPQSSAQP